MMKQNRSKLEVRSSIMRRDDSSSSSSSSLHINKYSYSKPTNALISDNHTYKVNNYTIDDGINAYYNYDNCHCTNLHHNCKNLTYCNADYTYDNQNSAVYSNGKYSYVNKDNYIDQDEDSFTFSSTVAGSMEFFNFNSPACTNEAEAMSVHGRLSNMSSADELFEDGKIRPLMQPIINGHDQPNRIINGEDQPNFPKPIFPKSVINGHDQPNRMLNGHDQPNSSKPIINGDDQPNHIINGQDQSEPMLDHNASSKSAVQSVISANDRAIKQIISANDAKQEIDAKTVRTTHHEGLVHAGKVDHGLSSEINQRLKEVSNDEAVISGMHSSLSAPASPVKDFLISTSQVSCYKRCRSLSRVLEFEDNEQLIEVQDSVEDGAKGGLLHMRKTLQDLLKQEEEPITINKPKMMKKKQVLGLETPNHENVINSYDALIKRPSLAPAPINIPQLWPVREKLLATPTSSNNKKVRTPSPHGIHYASQKAQAERMKKKTFLPYRPGLLGCLGYPPQ